MYLIYIDETKISRDIPNLYVGGILIKDDVLTSVERALMHVQRKFFGFTHLVKECEFHGEHIFNGKGSYRHYRLDSRVALLEELAQIIIDYKIPVRVMGIASPQFKQGLTSDFTLYNFTLQLLISSFSEFLSKHQDYGVIFADHENDEFSKSILTFSQFKENSFFSESERSHDRVIDTIYYTHSHHSRFIQLADVVMYLVNRYKSYRTPEKWHDKKCMEISDKIRQETEFLFEEWPMAAKDGETGSIGKDNQKGDTTAGL